MVKVAAFFMSMLMGFGLAIYAVVRVVGPKGIQENVCRYYAPDAKTLAQARAEKAESNYLALQNRRIRAKLGRPLPRPRPVAPQVPVQAAAPVPMPAAPMASSLAMTSPLVSAVAPVKAPAKALSKAIDTRLAKKKNLRKARSARKHRRARAKAVAQR